MLTNVKAVLFDLDGTLVDSMWMWKQIDIEYLEKNGFELPSNLQHEIEGMSFSETAVYFKEHFHVQKSLDEIKADWINMADHKYRHEVPMKSGALEFLKYLKSTGVKTGIATSNHRKLAETVINAHGLNPYIDCVLTACEVNAGKPSPDIYLKEAEILEVPVHRCLVFEDVPAGIQASLNANMRVCAVADAYSADRIDTIREMAHYFIESYDQIFDRTYQILREV